MSAMKCLFIVFCVLVTLVELGSCVSLASLAGQVDALAAHMIRCRRLPGLTVAVVRAAPEGGRQVLTRSYGLADVATNRTVDVNTRFCLAGITQCFTAATLTQLLHENNSFSLDSTIQSMLGGWFQLSDASRTRRVTVRDILSHRVGLAPYFGGVVLGYNFTRIELIRRLRHIPVTAPFRHSFVPNPLLYVLAGHLVQNLNDTFWENVIMRRLFKPLHMTGSTFADRVPNWAANFALPHVLRDGQLMPISSKITGNILRPVGPSNSICSTAPDMAEWMLMLLRNGTSHGDPVLNPRVIDEMFSAQNTHLPGTSKHVKGSLPVNITTDAYNLGWFSGTYRGHKRVFQNGFANYFGSFVTLFPEEGLGIFTAANGPSLTGMDNAFRALHYSISDLAMGESAWLNESTVCSYPKPWIMAQKKAVTTTINETKTTKTSFVIKNVTSTTTPGSNIQENESNSINNTNEDGKIDKLDINQPKTNAIFTPDDTTSSHSTTTQVPAINSTDYDLFLSSTIPLELKKVTIEDTTKVKINAEKTSLRPKINFEPEELRNETIGNDVTAQSRLRTFHTVSSERPRPTTGLPTANKSSERPNKNAPLGKPLNLNKTDYNNSNINKKDNNNCYTNKKDYNNSHTNKKDYDNSYTNKKDYNNSYTNKKDYNNSYTNKKDYNNSYTNKKDYNNSYTNKKPTTIAITTPDAKSSPTSPITQRIFGTSLLVEDFDDEIESNFDGIFGLRLPTDYGIDDEMISKPDPLTTTTKPTKIAKILPTKLPIHKQNKLISRRPINQPSTSSFGLFESTKTKHQKTKTIPDNERDNTIGRIQQSESILILSTTPHPRIPPSWLRRNQSQRNSLAPQISALDELVMKYITSTTPQSKQTNDFDAFILTDPFDITKIKSSTASPKMDPTVMPAYFTDVSASPKTSMDYLLEHITQPSKVTTILTSGQFPVMEKVNNFKNVQVVGGNNVGFHLPQSFWSTRYTMPTTPTLKTPKRQRLLFSSKRRLSGQHRQSRRSTNNYRPVTEPSLIEDDITETLVKFGIRLARRLKRQEKLPVLTSGTLQMEYGFYGKAHLLPYVQSNTFLLRFFSAVWYVSESDDSRRLPRSVFLVHFKGSGADGKPERFVVPFFDPRLPPIFVRVKSSDK
uniref:Beta-lactamase-related domain-containing protein n=1 Tax=Strigamia maritima TaxID=126957 RepID=T1INY4_STRMM